jgi:hypothetical protein
MAAVRKRMERRRRLRSWLSFSSSEPAGRQRYDGGSGAVVDCRVGFRLLRRMPAATPALLGTLSA